MATSYLAFPGGIRDDRAGARHACNTSSKVGAGAGFMRCTAKKLVGKAASKVRTGVLTVIEGRRPAFPNR